MHMRGHGEEYKTAAALAKPETRTTTTTTRCCVYSCPFVGCKRNREHRSFQPLKTAVCVKNHYRRSHCDKRHACRRCGVKRFSVLADLRTHEKHCGRDRWTCSCGTSFSRKDKLFAHVAAFHDDDHQNGSDPHQVLMVDSEATFGRMTTMADSMFDDFDYSSADIKGFTLSDGGRRFDNDDGRGFMSLMGGIDSSCDFDGVDLFGMPGLDFGTPCLTGF
ncbi:hypothetical protein PR202_ga14112 [Eleusine coracana subsp. coracana]|uniref:C2H2-type domain-containing protein n=1 Tax=Eleusine coracana subsp. coracana TaxID=191504 RepID=A0AAV5CFY2_ELECO|nr:hypothetical protein PR202_ga14112 [Eleusine coracana subsp. coracana]